MALYPVHFKFKSEVSFRMAPLTGSAVNGKTLRDFLYRTCKINEKESELILMHADTMDHIEDTDAVAKNSSVIVQRAPKKRQARRKKELNIKDHREELKEALERHGSLSSPSTSSASGSGSPTEDTPGSPVENLRDALRRHSSMSSSSSSSRPSSLEEMIAGSPQTPSPIRIPAEYECMECRRPLREAVIVSCCGCSGCKQCVYAARHRTGQCFYCKEPFDMGTDIVNNRILNALVITWLKETGWKEWLTTDQAQSLFHDHMSRQQCQSTSAYGKVRSSRSGRESVGPYTRPTPPEYGQGISNSIPSVVNRRRR